MNFIKDVQLDLYTRPAKSLSSKSKKLPWFKWINDGYTELSTHNVHLVGEG